MSTEAREFLDSVFGMWIDEDHLVSVWNASSKRTTFCPSVDRAVEAVGSTEGDTYCGVGFYRKGITGGRGKASDVISIPALWADIDFGDHHKKKVAPDEQAARRLVGELGVRPSILVHSGHGLQAWWMLSEPMTPDDGAGELARNWIITIQKHGKKHGCAVDSVHDLARVMRVPGTMNCKAEPVPVRLLELHPQRYEPIDFEPFMEWEPLLEAPKVKVEIKAPQQLDDERITALIANDPKFVQTWGRNRNDFHDHSASAYDLALANAGVMIGLEDQEIADLIYTWRCKHGENGQKASRPDYIASTIGRARTGMDPGQVLEVSESKPADPRAAILKQISDQIGLPVVGWLQYGEENALYSLQLEDRSIFIGPVGNVVSQSKFRAAVYEVLASMPKKQSAGSWTMLCNLLGKVRECVPAVECSRVGQALEWTEHYLDNSERPRCIDEEERTEHMRGNRPWLDEDGHVWITTIKLFSHVKHVLGEPVMRRSFNPVLKAAGWTVKRFDLPIPGRKTPLYRWYWRSPDPHETEES